MKLGMDAKRAVNNMTGLGNYSRLVIEQLATEYPSDTLYLYTPKLKRNPRLAPIDALHNVQWRLPAPSGFGGSLWRTFGITNVLRPDGVDIYHGLSNELPLNIQSAGVPAVVTVHDLIFRRMPECYTPIDRRLYDWKYGRSCINATRIIAISERTRDDITDLYGIDPDKIDVIYQGCDDSFKRILSPSQLDEVRQRYNLPRDYVLQVGTIEKRKNLELSVRALSALPAHVKLVALGRDRLGYKREVQQIAQQCGVADRIVWLEGIPFSDLPALNQMALAVLYPSHYEGFGIPVLEGLESRRPVIAATGSCLEEAGGDAALYVSPTDPRAMAVAINSILDGSADVGAMTQRGLRHAARFNTADIATKLHATYRRAIDQYNTCR